MKRRADGTAADGTRARVWDTETLRGRMFVQFVALCYYEYLSDEIRNIKMTLGVRKGTAYNEQCTGNCPENP